MCSSSITPYLEILQRRGSRNLAVESIDSDRFGDGSSDEYFNDESTILTDLNVQIESLTMALTSLTKTRQFILDRTNGVNGPAKAVESFAMTAFVPPISTPLNNTSASVSSSAQRLATQSDSEREVTSDSRQVQPVKGTASVDQQMTTPRVKVELYRQMTDEDQGERTDTVERLKRENERLFRSENVLLAELERLKRDLWKTDKLQQRLAAQTTIIDVAFEKLRRLQSTSPDSSNALRRQTSSRLENESSAGHVTRLKELRSQLVNSICADSVAAVMLQRDLLSMDDVDSIRRRQDSCKAADQLIDVVLRSSVDVYKCFLQALTETGQVDAHLRLIEPDFNQQKDEHIKLLRQHYSFLRDNVDSVYSGLVELLRNDDVINGEEAEELNNEGSPTRRCELLLSTLTRKSMACFYRFLAALDRTGQRHIANVVRGMTRADVALRQTSDSCSAGQLTVSSFSSVGKLVEENVRIEKQLLLLKKLLASNDQQIETDELKVMKLQMTPEINNNGINLSLGNKLISSTTTRAELNEVTRQLEKEKRDSARLQERLTTAYNECSKLQAQKAERDANADLLASKSLKCARLKADLGTRTNECAKLRQELEQRQQQCNELQEEVSKLKIDLDKKTSELAEVHKQQSVLRSMASLRSSLSAYSSQSSLIQSPPPSQSPSQLLSEPDLVTRSSDDIVISQFSASNGMSTVKPPFEDVVEVTSPHRRSNNNSSRLSNSNRHSWVQSSVDEEQMRREKVLQQQQQQQPVTCNGGGDKTTVKTRPVRWPSMSASLNGNGSSGSRLSVGKTAR